VKINDREMHFVFLGRERRNIDEDVLSSFVEGF
jgi:hypothetical protein